MKAALPLLRLPLRPLLLRPRLPPTPVKTTRLLPLPRASWLKRTASTWPPLPALAKAVALPRKTWWRLLPTRSRHLLQSPSLLLPLLHRS
ncbi:hypothetical protein D3C76_1464450 [compost metagenome]